ncbi:MAG: phosphoglycerate dehydrogenase [Acidimicrobiales bacterium]|jgi:D-3-phosphoglycerate dehydrogenase / 2-oxoglutarate reductase
MARILVTEKLAAPGLELMASAGHHIDVQLSLTPAQLLDAVEGAAALVIRSATIVSAEVLEAGSDLVAVGRAGVGLDNVDVEAATRRGVMVVNAPESNILSAAEHAIALMLAQARNIPQAHGALVEGRWERSKWEGVELNGKTLGIIGLGRVGSLVAKRAAAFGMRLLAYDPYVTPDRARQIGAELLELGEVFTNSDFVSIHLPKTPETVGLVGKELLAKSKPGIRIVNTARGGIVDEEALADAIASGHVGGAALDVFATEPCTSSPLFGLERVVVTPHLGASTAEAQDKAGEQIAEQIVLALAGELVPYAVNVAATGSSDGVRVFHGVAERLGSLLAALCEGVPSHLEIECQGELAGEDTRILTLCALKGVFAAATDEPVSYVNVPRFARDHGLDVRESSTTIAGNYLSQLTLRGGGHAASGTLGWAGTERIVMVDDHAVELPFAANLLIVRNDDRPGMIGLVGSALGDAGVSITNMAVGQTSGGGTALMLLSTDRPVPRDVLGRLHTEAGILDLHSVAGA